MGVTVKFFANFREATGEDRVTLSGISNVAELLDELVKRFGSGLSDLLYESQGGKLRDSVNILVNGKGIAFLGGLNAKLSDGDVVAIFPPISGG
jgi:MoaD family protein